jgi:hypothetical protein
MRTRLVVLSLAVMICGSATGTILQAAEPVPTSKPARDDPNRVICRREAVTGYYSVTRKVCMTRAEWIERTRSAQADGQRLQEQGLINSCRSADRSGC